ncbi:phosphoglycerate mutase-like protein [Aspergillus uvarum CBS 121591]|uniref:Phosphoglycerate mutase-like protein n=1 Tax=Aspergillus uvarum CBS 121591 TaxID=1448315 RepID=A0A319CHS7_9EURO|nr:phosphoglycerate mutase-like protein [Aspergillus uvarum CBS 121591]PYH84774.1 phosphoglycerate mutase-like protein [Aspergillus uvarum CBS 121591]
MLRTIFRIPLIIPILLVATLLTAGFLLMAESTPSESHWRFSIVPGYFLQSEPTTDAGSFDYVSANFGLIPRPYDSDPEFDPEGNKTQWERFEHQVRTLNRDAEPDTAYKVLFLGRHGQGYHNVAEAKYGTELWDCYWSLLDGDDNGTWVDARLTPLGISQAQTAHSAWKTQLAHKIPTPESYYVSPLNRCLATANHTFSGLGIPHTDPFRPLIKELLRETIGQHTCDGRSTKSAIEAEYPLYRIEPGFAEADPLYDARLRESDSARDKRFRDLFQDIFSHDGNTFLSLTAHSGAITSMLQITGHRAFALETGGVIPIFVKAERVAGALPPMHVDPWFPPPVCKNGAVPGSG